MDIGLGWLGTMESGIYNFDLHTQSDEISCSYHIEISYTDGDFIEKYIKDLTCYIQLLNHKTEWLTTNRFAEAIIICRVDSESVSVRLF